MAATEKVTLTMPRDLMKEVRKLAPPRAQSKYIADAVRYFIEEQKSQALRERLIAGYVANAEADAALAAEWEATDIVDWERYAPPYEGEEPAEDEGKE